MSNDDHDSHAMTIATVVMAMLIMMVIMIIIMMIGVMMTIVHPTIMNCTIWSQLTHFMTTLLLLIDFPIFLIVTVFRARMQLGPPAC